MSIRKFGAEPQPQVEVDPEDEQGLSKTALRKLAQEEITEDDDPEPEGL